MIDSTKSPAPVGELAALGRSRRPTPLLEVTMSGSQTEASGTAEPARTRPRLARSRTGRARAWNRSSNGDNRRVDAPRMVYLGYRKYVRSDRIYALEAIRDGRGAGRRTNVWVEGIAEPIVASRTERAIL